MKQLKKSAQALLLEFKGKSYVFGVGCLDKVGELASPFGKKALLITNIRARSEKEFSVIIQSLEQAGNEVIGPVQSARPNAPQEDVLRLVEEIKRAHPDCIVVVAGGSGIDAAKAANVLSVLGGDCEDYFGVGRVTQKVDSIGRSLIPLVAVQTASCSAAHLTKYSNITNVQKSQKKLMADEAIIPPKALFDYALARTMPPSLTVDGAFDGLSHCLEVFFGASEANFSKVQKIAETGLELIIRSVEKALGDGENIEAREDLGLGTDLGGYAIMVGGTSGPHLTSFSLVDILSHGRACAIMSPYFTVFFSPAIQRQLKILIKIYAKYGLVAPGAAELTGRDLAEAVAFGMLNLAQRLSLPTTLDEIQGYSGEHIKRILAAAKDPQLEMKLKSMPVPLDSGMVDGYLAPILEAARTGNFRLIRNM